MSINTIDNVGKSGGGSGVAKATIETKAEVAQSLEVGDLMIVTDEQSPDVITVADRLDSTATGDALSANQGRILDGKITTLNSNLTLNYTESSLTPSEQNIQSFLQKVLTKLFPKRVSIFSNGTIGDIGSFTFYAQNTSDSNYTLTNTINITAKNNATFGYCNLVGDNAIDLTDFTQFRFDVTSLNKISDSKTIIGLCSSKPSNYSQPTFAVKQEVSSTGNSYLLDISSLSGNYYFVIYSQGGGASGRNITVSYNNIYVE